MSGIRGAAALVALAVAVSIALVDASGQVLLKNAFIEKYRNLVTIDTDFKVDDAHPQPNPIGTSSQDGDLHMAGRSADVGLPMVAELSNGRLTAVADVEKAIHQANGTGTAVHLSGVWRLWMEHKSAEPMQQGDVVPVPINTNPKHVFEIHPVTAFSGTAVLETFVPLHDDKDPSRHYQASDAPTAFARYEKETLTVSRGATFTSIDGAQVPYNYTEFIFEVAGQPAAVADGVFVLAKILDLQKHILVSSPRRMVIVKGSRPATLISTATAGTQFHVLGIPRVNLDALMRAVQPNKKGTVSGAYEMIILAVIE
jgi:hypothetical protein